MQSDITLEAGQTTELIYLLGRRKSEEAAVILNEYKEQGKVDREVEELKNYWHSTLDRFQVNTPSEEFNKHEVKLDVGMYSSVSY